MDKGFLLSRFYKMSDILSDKLLGWRRQGTAIHRREVPARAGATLGNFWAERRQKSGVAPARFDLFAR